MAVSSIISPIFRLSFPQVFKARAMKNPDGSEGTPKYSINMLFVDQSPYLPKDANGELICPKNMKPEAFAQLKADYAKDPTLLIQIRRLLHAACVEKWGPDKTKWSGVFRHDPAKQIIGLDFETYVDSEGKRWPIQNGNLKTYQGYEGHLFARASCGENYKPGVVARDGKTPLTQPGQVCAGMLARAKINAYAWSHKLGGSGVSLGLAHLQIILDDGVRYGGGEALTDDTFGAYEGAADDPSAYDAPGGTGAAVAEEDGGAF